MFNILKFIKNIGLRNAWKLLFKYDIIYENDKTFLVLKERYRKNKKMEKIKIFMKK
jgi:hypothetical protein